MLGPETFVTELSVVVDTFCKTALPPDRHPGRAATLDRSEVLTLAIVGQGARFRGERDVWHYAEVRLRPLVPRLPSRPQFNRQVRRHRPALAAFALWLAGRRGGAAVPYEVVDGAAVPTRNAERRGRGWLAGLADVGQCLRRGWIHGLRMLVCATPAGAVTGWGVGPASSTDRALAETLFAHRADPAPALPSAGETATGVSLADSGCAGVACEARWVAVHHAQVVAPPQTGGHRAWSPPRRRWAAGRRQIVETVIGRLEAPFRL